jgi:A/G-specific adenine glycosylase
MKKLSSDQQKAFVQNLLRWYKKNHRPLPWRETKDPYAIWISEVMLQQTRVLTAAPYFEGFLKRFPTVDALAKASLDSVLKAWEGLGYYSRARNLHRSAQIIATQLKGRFPHTRAALSELPGIGKYTSAAIASIAFDRDEPVLDGNVRRVLARVLCIKRDPKLPKVEKELEEILRKILPKGKAAFFNQAIMELGAIICLPKTPNCPECPVEELCEAKRAGVQRTLPVQTQRPARPHHHVAIGIIWKDSKLLITQRPQEGLLGGLWEFPGGKQRPDESLEECLRRELKEELDIEVRIKRQLPTVRHEYTHFRVMLHPFECEWKRGRPKALGCIDWAWVKPEELKNYAFPRANHKIFRSLFAHELNLGSS